MPPTTVSSPATPSAEEAASAQEARVTAKAGEKVARVNVRLVESEGIGTVYYSVSRGGHAAVLRRFKHFEALHRQLLALPDCADPPELPEKHLIGLGLWRDREETLKQRADALEAFLSAACSLDSARAKQLVETFLQSTTYTIEKRGLDGAVESLPRVSPRVSPSGATYTIDDDSDSTEATASTAPLKFTTTACEELDGTTPAVRRRLKVDKEREEATEASAAPRVAASRQRIPTSLTTHGGFVVGFVVGLWWLLAMACLQLGAHAASTERVAPTSSCASHRRASRTSHTLCTPLIRHTPIPRSRQHDGSCARHARGDSGSQCAARRAACAAAAVSEPLLHGRLVAVRAGRPRGVRQGGGVRMRTRSGACRRDAKAAGRRGVRAARERAAPQLCGERGGSRPRVRSALLIVVCAPVGAGRCLPG